MTPAYVVIRMKMKKGQSLDFLFISGTGALAWSIVALSAVLVYQLVRTSMPSIHAFGWHFLVSSEWDAVKEHFGILPVIYGTLISSLVALIIAVPLSLGIAIYLAELAPLWLRAPLGFMIELLAAIPSVIYGLWGIFVLAPFLRNFIQPFLGKYLGFLPFFQGPNYGVGMLAAGVILSIMIIPTITSISREVFATTPTSLKEAAFAIGATRWEMIRLVLLPYGQSGVLGAVILGLGRALGETMAVTMVIGNRPDISISLFAPGYTMASIIANEFAEATSNLYVSALMEIALILFVLTLLVNIIARALVWSVSHKLEGGAA
jgi:phosphate transport system permease protein